MNISRLPNDEIVLLELATWLYNEWLHKNPKHTLDSTIELLRSRAEKDTIPLSIIARENDGTLAGTASLTERDMGKDFGPWLSGVYVSMLHREKGIGSMLCKQIHEEARTLDFNELFLFTKNTPTHIHLYQRLGYEILSKEKYLDEEVVIMKITL